MKKINLKENRIGNWFYHKKTYFFAFLIPAVLMFAVYAAFGCYPFGDNSVLVLDLNGQYVYYYEAMRDAFWGRASFFYSWGRNLGGEMIGIFSYYLASPFSLIVMLFPRTMLLESLLIMQLFKLGAAGLTFAFYLRKSKRVGEYSTLLFSTLYAMMAYAVVQLMDPMWLDGLVYLPLIIYGVEKLVDDGKMVRMILPLALMFIANFYIGWMVAIFTALYFLYYVFFACKEEDTTSREKVRVFLKFGLSAVVSALCAACILIPVYYSLKLGKLEFTTPDFSLRANFTLMDFFTKLLPESYDTVRNEGLPMIYCGILTMFMVPLYFLNNNIELRKKIGNGALVTAVLFSMYLSTVDIAWHGFQVPNWLPYRYSFVFSFVLLVMAAEAFERIEGISYKQLGTTFIGLLVYIIYVDAQKYENLETTKAIWFSLLCTAGFAMLLFHYKRNAGVKAMPLILLILVAGELFGNSLETLKSINSDVVYSKHSSYVPYIDEGREVTQKLEEYDDGFYRTEKTFHRTVNDAMAFGTRGISHSSSTLNAGPINFLYSLGYTSGGHYVKYKGDTLVTDALLGIKYIMNKDKTVFYDDAVVTQDDITIYENPNALSIGYMADDAIKNLSVEQGNPFVNQNSLLSSLLSQEYVEYFKPIAVSSFNLDNVQETNAVDQMKYARITAGDDASLEFQIEAPTDDIIYMFLPTNYYSGHELNIWVNQVFLDQYYETENYCIKTLGKFTAGETVTITAMLNKDDVFLKDKWFYYLDQDLFESAIANLKQSQWNITKYTDTYLEGNITAAEGQTMMTTIPYEPGWTVRVDGKKVDYYKISNALIGVDVPAGEHVVTMRFFPAGLKIGLIVSGVGVLIVVFLALYERKTRRVLLRRLYN